MNKKITQLEHKLEKVKKDKAKAQGQKEEAEKRIKSCIAQEKDLEAQLLVALSEESGLSYQEMKELVLPTQSSNQGVTHV